MYEPGPPSVLKVEERPVPSAKNGEVLIKIMAAGMNRSEMFTRQGMFLPFRSPLYTALDPNGAKC